MSDKLHSGESPPNGGVTCKCGHTMPFGVYVAAHWDVELTCTCEICKTKYLVQSGEYHEVGRCKKKPAKTKGGAA